jgi:acetylornithine deacetylase/succinyl-diaminopimelate desuccinylase-like protein
MPKPRARFAKITKAIGSRILFYGAILWGAWWWMLWTPGHEGVPLIKALNADESGFEREVRNDINFLAGNIGERNLPDKAEELEQAAAFIDRSMNLVGYQPRSHWYTVLGTKCRNVIAEIRGTNRPEEVVIVGAHYDSVPGSPGADDNASGVAVMLALARRFAGTRPTRTLRFVGFANEEPPYFWSDDMGSVVYAKECHQHGDHVVAMLSIESVGSIPIPLRASGTRRD